MPKHTCTRHQSGGGAYIIDGTTAVDCQKQMRCWSLVQLLIPSCACNFVDQQHNEQVDDEDEEGCHNACYLSSPSTSTTITGTIFGYRRGKVSFCIHPNSHTTTPILLLGFTVPTPLLAKEMQTGLLTIALKCDLFSASRPNKNSAKGSLFSVPVWTMHCNGRKVGYAIKRHPTKADIGVLRLMRAIGVGAGIIGRNTCSANTGSTDDGNELMYLRANFRRVSGSSDSESFHLINPDGGTRQELSIFFLRS